MRVGGLVNILIENIDLNERKIITQEKSTANNSGLNTYFIPKKFVWDLEAFILERKNLLPDEIRLFLVLTKTIRK